MAILEAAKSFFFLNLFFSLYRNDVENEKKNVKKYTYSALISSPGRWIGNRISFKDGLIVAD